MLRVVVRDRTAYSARARKVTNGRKLLQSVGKAEILPLYREGLRVAFAPALLHANHHVMPRPAISVHDGCDGLI